MEIKFYDGIVTKSFKEEIWEILCECDKDFFPPLSARESSSQKDLLGLTNNTSKPVTYFNQMIQQKFIVAFNKSKEVMAFMTFIHQYQCEELQKLGESNYITTICVGNKYRNKGILTKLYDFMENNLPEEYYQKYISTRTWSTNEYHLRILEKRGYAISTKLKDHRGKGIDTIYYYKKCL